MNDFATTAPDVSVAPRAHTLVPPGPVVVAARGACAALALANAAAVAGMIFVAAARQGLSGGAYAASLASLIVAGLLFAFLAAHRPTPNRLRAFARIATITAVIQAVFLTTLLLFAADSPARSVPVFRGALLALTLLAIAAFGLILNRAATHHVLLQIGHRAFSLALWILITRVILDLWGRPFPWTDYLLDAAFILLALGGVTSLIVLWTSRDLPPKSTESRHLTQATAVLLLLTFAWLTLPSLFHVAP